MNETSGEWCHVSAKRGMMITSNVILSIIHPIITIIHLSGRSSQHTLAYEGRF
jgi:hypothetical protein